ncbi:TetR/AcrR family transcriptional regulator [uncultured Roseibium sp.]|uniref:TetR/AcrR family transcriptional regulator n=1 Tax=uncultured Roseibium sp. TaxID=1936171 RepID=UPI00260BF23F|nr:TetR/AcrR family transcriptional regulator [uncultured Roseibium sp.]
MPVTSRRSPDDLCRSMLERNADVISVQKPDVALKKLKLIILAALKLSNRKGFQAMSLRDLSKEAGVSMGGLYAYFDSKTTLLNMVLTEVTSSVQTVLGNPPTEVTGDPIEHLKWLIEAHIRLTDDMLPWFSFAFMEAKNFPAKEREMAVDSEELTEKFFADVTERAKAEGRFRTGVTPLLPTLIKPLLQDWYVKRAKYRRRGVTVDEYVRTVQNIVLSACLPIDQISDLTHTDQTGADASGSVG